MTKATTITFTILAALVLAAIPAQATDGRPPIEEDYGDAPDSYGTLLASDGARHGFYPGYGLGPAVDTEADGQPTALADGDDNFPVGPGDEDGVVLTGLVAGSPNLVIVDGGPSGGMLDGWIDSNDNGVFDHPTEHLWGGVSQAILAGPNAPLQFTLPVVAVPGPTYARFRLTIDGGYLPTGPAPDGEVEDYPCEIQGLTANEKASWGWMKSMFK